MSEVRYRCPRCANFIIKALDGGTPRKVELWCPKCKPPRLVVVTLRGDESAASHLEAAGLR
jgi:hypothetical protein